MFYNKDKKVDGVFFINGRWVKLSGKVGVFAFDWTKSTCHNITVRTLYY